MAATTTATTATLTNRNDNTRDGLPLTHDNGTCRRINGVCISGLCTRINHLFLYCMYIYIYIYEM